jgi:RNA polymerase sigma factor (sigma-70 family)
MSMACCAALTRRYGDFDSAEDAAQEALVAAATRWPTDGVPQKPDAWLIQAASRRFIDQRRSDVSRRAREAMAVRLAAVSGPPPAIELERDDSLLVLFMCCHPALTPASSIALTLRAVGGLTTAEIANAFLVPEATLAQRISRAKERIRASEAPIAMPSPDEQGDRLRLVRHVLYLIFNEGYTASGGDALQRTDLADEAIRLARLLNDLRAGEPESTGLLALMLLIDARRAARATADGLPVPLADQDRSRWDLERIAEGRGLLDEAMALGRVGEYQLQAAIAALHDAAPTADATDWPQIAALYGLLERITDNPIVTLNRAVAVGMADEPQAGLAIVDTVAGRLSGNARLDAVRGYLLERAGDLDGAVVAYRAAAARSTSILEQRYLVMCAARLARASGA